MYKGKLWLDHEDMRFTANISGCVWRDSELRFEFSGNDSYHGKFDGEANLRKEGALYIGPGKFIYLDGESVPAVVSVAVKTDHDGLSIEGHWRDQNESEAYELYAELERV